MTTFQKAIVVSVVLVAIVVGLYQARQVSGLREEVQALHQQKEEQEDLSRQVQQLQKERDNALKRLAALSGPGEPARKGTNEVIKLRGEVGRLRRENADTSSSSGLSKVTANPEAKKMLRVQQKLGMTMIYKEFSKKANLSTEQTGQLNDLLADNIMENVDHVTKVLRDKPAPDQVNEIFAAQETALQQKVQALLGQDGLAQYQDYTKNLL